MGYERHRELNVPSSVLAYHCHRIVPETDISEVNWRIAVYEIIVTVLSFFLACVLNGLCFFWGLGERFPGSGARGLLFSFSSCVLFYVGDITTVKLFYDSTLNLADTLPVCRNLEEIDCSLSS